MTIKLSREVYERYAKKEKGSLLTLIIMVLLVTFFTRRYDTCLDSYNYIMSSISQSLAALLAIIMAIIILFSREFPPVSETERPIILTYEIDILILFYAIGIIAPLIGMQIQSETWLDGCIIWATICIFSLRWILHRYGLIFPKLR